MLRPQAQPSHLPTSLTPHGLTGASGGSKSGTPSMDAEMWARNQRTIVPKTSHLFRCIEVLAVTPVSRDIQLDPNVALSFA
jgi:hypothetical protein